MLVFSDQTTILRVALFMRPFINLDKLQTFPEENFMNTPFVSKRAPIYADVPDEKWPREDKAERPPVSPGAPFHREELIGEPFAEPRIEPAVCTHPREQEIRQQKKRHDLHGHEREGLRRNVGGFAADDPSHAEDDDEEAINERIIEARRARGGTDRA